MFWIIFVRLTDYGSGLMFSTLLADIITFMFFFIFTRKFIVPAVSTYSFSKRMDALCGTDSKHWFYGHMKKYAYNHEGMLNVVRRTATMPYMHNTWYGTLYSQVFCYHPDINISVLGSGAPKNDFGYFFMRRWLGDGLLISKGKKWKRNRRLLTPAFHYKILHQYNTIFNESVRVLIQKLKKQAGNPVEMSDPIGLMTLDSLMQCAMSSKTDCQNIRGGHPYIEALHQHIQTLMDRLQNPLYAIDWMFYLTKAGKRNIETANIMHSYTKKIISERRESIRGQSESEEEERYLLGFKSGDKKLLDFLDILIQTKDEDGNGLTDGEIRDEVDTFLFEGQDTTASALSWAVYNLAKHPEYQEKCREEVMSIIKKKEDVEWDDLSEFCYLTMFLKESMRLYAPVPTIARKLHEPLQLSHSNTPNKVIPVGADTTVSIFAQHRHEHIWENPLVFDPERFTQENIAKRSPHAYIPFSAGNRNCIGQNFAMNEMKIVLAQLLRSLKFYLDDDTPEPILLPSLVLRGLKGIIVKFDQIEC